MMLAGTGFYLHP